MRNAEQSPDQPSDLTRVTSAYRGPRPGNGADAGARPGNGTVPRPGPGNGRIRYAHGGMRPRVGPFCPVSRGTSVHHGGIGCIGGAGGIAEFSGEPWAARFPVAGASGHRNDLWVLVCGSIAAVVAFAAAFAASGGLVSGGAASGGAVSHPATPSAVPAVVSQACPSPAAGLTAGSRSGPTP
jgi:hypothetical protein